MNTYRIRLATALPPLVSVFFSLFFSAPASAQGDVESPDISREAMWRAPTVEEWKKPCLITWERTWDDAVAIAKETNKPILVCINMDGEIASEHYAGVRYRQPEVTDLYKPYVCVIASVYRHTPQDYDTDGNRVPCPRFGGVTCGEHIRIEPFLYERFMDEKRISPRHIMVELDAGETYDMYYAFDTQSVFDTIADGIDQRDRGPVTEIRGDRPLLERVASRHVKDRQAVETAYEKGDTQTRRALLEAALLDPAPVSPDLLRLAVFGLDGELASLARQVLAKAEDASAVDLLAETLATPMEAQDKEALVGALDRLADKSPRAQTLATVHKGLGGRSKAVDSEAWATALAAQYTAAPMISAELKNQRLADQNQILEQADPDVTLELAESFLTQSMDEQDQDFAKLLLMDANQTAQKAERLGARGWRLDAVLSVCAFYLDDRATAYARAESAVNAMPSGETSWNAMAVLDLFAKMRWKGIADAAVAKKKWPGEWLTDIHAAHAVLLKHPLGTDQQVVWLYDRLDWLGAKGQARRAVEQGLQRFPESEDLHDRLRTFTLESRGIEGLVATYEALLRKPDAPPAFLWFAGYASLVAAEFERRQSDPVAAAAAYDQGTRYYDEYKQADPERATDADHYLALAIAGRARLALESEDLDKTSALVLQAFDQKPESAGSLDGLGLSAVATANTLIARATEADRQDIATKIRSAIDGLPAVALIKPIFEQNNGPVPADRGRGRLDPRGPRPRPGRTPGGNGPGGSGPGGSSGGK